MKLIVFDRIDSWHVADLQRAAAAGQTVTASSYDDAGVSIDRSGRSMFVINDHDASQFDCIVTRAMPASSLQQVVFRMDWLARLQQQTSVVVVNPARTIEASVDKYLSLELIRANNVPVPRTLVSQTVGAAMKHFRDLDGDSVVKPIFGSGGRGIFRLNDETTAKIQFAEAVARGDVIYQQQYIEHGNRDLRLLTIGDEVLGMLRHRPGQWITNARLGAECAGHQPNRLEIDLALASAQAVGALISGVDLVYDATGSPYVVEINACPSWKAMSTATGLDVSAKILKLIGNLVRSRARPAVVPFPRHPDAHHQSQ